MKRYLTISVALMMILGMTFVSSAALPEVLDAKTGIPQGWVSFKIRTSGPESPISIRTSNGNFENGVSLGYSSFREDGTPLDSVAFTAYYARTWYKADINTPFGVSVEQEETLEHYTAQVCTEYKCGWTVTTSGYQAGTYKFLIWVAGRPLVDWSYYIVDNPGIELLATDSGTGAFFHMTEDFTGIAEVKAALLGAGARASVSVDKVMEVQGTLLAWYLQPMIAGCCQATALANPQMNLLSITTPKGELDCNLGCTIRSFKDPDRYGPGAYVFHNSGAGAGVLTDAYDVTLIGTDARLPD